jgi:hypothetical protein
VSGYKDKVLKRAGRTRLVARVFKDRVGTTKLWIEEPIPGSRSAVTRTYFSSLEAADRALGNLSHTTHRAYDWALGRDSAKRPANSDESWRLR